jgi:hypothetical protein
METYDKVIIIASIMDDNDIIVIVPEKAPKGLVCLIEDKEEYIYPQYDSIEIDFPW